MGVWDSLYCLVDEDVRKQLLKVWGGTAGIHEEDTFTITIFGIIEECNFSLESTAMLLSCCLKLAWCIYNFGGNFHEKKWKRKIKK